ncbi:hypothetical protein BYT27DRAFT_7105837 [Phlegmacium glaucopus]|nr:hypothetical protein BYT27DRAFT_7105837 [Phlegmacium glaucopus]
MVVTNTISGRRDVVTLFYENKLGVDVDDNYHIVVFDGSESMKGHAPLKSHLTFYTNRPSDRFLRLHFQRCLTVRVCGGDPTEDYRDQEIDLFIEELGVYDDEMDMSDPRWMTPLGIEVYAYLIRQNYYISKLGVCLPALDSTIQRHSAIAKGPLFTALSSVTVTLWGAI